MKLMVLPGACSIGIHAMMAQIGKPFEIQKIDGAKGEQRTPEYMAINPKSKVPALVRDDGTVVTEFPAIAFWLAGNNPEAGLFPVELEDQVRAIEALDYVVATVHMQGFTRIFRPSNFTPDPAKEDEVKAAGAAQVEKGFAILDQKLEGNTFVTGKLSFADFALFYVEFWAAKRMGKTLPPNLQRHWEAMNALPGVQKALKEEGFA
jgi:glutathione S-transferase